MLEGGLLSFGNLLSWWLLLTLADLQIIDAPWSCLWKAKVKIPEKTKVKTQSPRTLRFFKKNLLCAKKSQIFVGKFPQNFVFKRQKKIFFCSPNKKGEKHEIKKNNRSECECEWISSFISSLSVQKKAACERTRRLQQCPENNVESWYRKKYQNSSKVNIAKINNNL